MSEQTVPKIEDEIRARLDDGLKQSALKFIAYLNANQMTPKQWFGPGFWHIPWGNNYLFGIHLYGYNSAANNNGWVFWFFTGDYSGEADKELINLVQKSAGSCVKCSGDCQQGMKMTFFGKDYTNICCQFPVRIENADGETLEKVKKLIEFWKEIAPRSKSFHAH